MRARLVLPLAAVAVIAPAAVVGAQLPDPDCLRLLRRARVLELESRPAEQIAWLERARNDCSEPVAALTELLRVHRNHPLPDDEIQQVRKDLIAAFDSESGAPAPGVLEYIARGEGADSSVLLAAFGLVERRLAEEGVDRGRFLRLKALLSRRLGRMSEATDTLVDLRALEPENEEIAWALLRLLNLEQRWPEAVDLLAGMVTEGDPRIRSAYAAALTRVGRLDEANRQLEVLGGEVDRSDPLALNDYVAALLESAWQLRDTSRDEEAERFFRLVEEHAPAASWGSVEAKSALAHLYGTKEELAAHRQAEEDHWERVSDPQSLINEGVNQLSSGNFDRAIELLERAAGEVGHLEAVWYNLGFAAYRAERWEKAEASFARAGELNANRADTFLFRGLALMNLERHEDAIPPLLRAAELDPERRQVHYQLWVCYRVLGREEEAARHQAAYDSLPP